MALDQPAHLHVLGEDEGRFAFGLNDLEQVVEGVEFSRAAGQWSRFVEVLGRVIAHLFELVQQPKNQGSLVRGVGLNAGEAVVGHRLVQGGLLRGERHEQVGLGLGRQFRGDARIGFAAPQQERSDQAAEPLGGLRVGVALDGAGQFALKVRQRSEQAGGGPVQKGPQFRQPPILPGAHPPGPRSASAQRCAVFDVEQREGRPWPALLAAVEPFEVDQFDVCASGLEIDQRGSEAAAGEEQ